MDFLERLKNTNNSFKQEIKTSSSASNVAALEEVKEKNHVRDIFITNSNYLASNLEVLNDRLSIQNEYFNIKYHVENNPKKVIEFFNRFNRDCFNKNKNDVMNIFYLLNEISFDKDVSVFEYLINDYKIYNLKFINEYINEDELNEHIFLLVEKYETLLKELIYFINN